MDNRGSGQPDPATVLRDLLKRLNLSQEEAREIIDAGEPQSSPAVLMRQQVEARPHEDFASAPPSAITEPATVTSLIDRLEARVEGQSGPRPVMDGFLRERDGGGRDGVREAMEATLSSMPTDAYSSGPVRPKPTGDPDLDDMVAEAYEAAMAQWDELIKPLQGMQLEYETALGRAIDTHASIEDRQRALGVAHQVGAKLVTAWEKTHKHDAPQIMKSFRESMMNVDTPEVQNGLQALRTSTAIPERIERVPNDLDRSQRDLQRSRRFERERSLEGSLDGPSFRREI